MPVVEMSDESPDNASGTRTNVDDVERAPEVVKDDGPPPEKEEVKRDRVPPATEAYDGDDMPWCSAVWLSRGEYAAMVREITAMIKAAKDKGVDVNIDPDWWSAFVGAGKSTVPFADIGMLELADMKRVWSQLPKDMRFKYMNSFETDPVINGETLEGDRAVRLARQALGGGAPQNLPLVQSGFNISIRPPLDGDWSELDEIISEQRKTFGWDTYGVAYSNYSTYLLQAVFEWALGFISGTSIDPGDEKITVADLVRREIDYFDIPVLLAYVAHASYPDGFTYVRPYVTESDENTSSAAMVQERINLYRCVLHDWDKLTPEMLDHMLKRARNSMPLADVRKYRETLSKMRSPVPVEIAPTIKIEVATPAFGEVILSTDRWLAHLKESVMSALTVTRTDGARQQSIRKASRLATMRAYAAWIKAIHISHNGEWGKVVRQEDIEQILLDTKNETAIAKAMYREVLLYMGRSLTSMVCVPVDPDLEGMPDDFRGTGNQRLVPMDILSVVFILLERVGELSNG